jgi:hypothetical protein
MRPLTRLPLLLGLLAVLAFSPALAFGFVYDDAWTIVDNAWLERPLGELVGLLASGEALARNVPDATRPAMVLSLWLDRRLFGLSPVGHHLTSLLLYGLVTFVATRLGLRLSGRLVVTAVAGAFFSLAPLHAEPVAAVNYREDLLSALGVVTAWLLLVERGASRPGRTWLAAAALAVALLAKESSIVVVPLVAVTLVALPHLRDRVRKRQGMLFALGAVFALWALWRVPLFLKGDDIPMAPDRGALTVGDSGGDTRSYRVSFAKIREHMPEFRTSWTAERGARQLKAVFDRIGLTREMFEAPPFTRLKEIKHLRTTGQVDAALFWTASEPV